ncbi:hypothetical protein KAR91_46155 [Candidatus Pacearchaeota archaeon]|nr:hypothetical protein [Candidatus Pacearchaeota archaeon]
MSKEFITYEKYGELLIELVAKLKDTDVASLDNVYGPPRGGLPIAVHLSHFLDLDLVMDESNLSLVHRDMTLFVDDIADTGRTFEMLDKGGHVGLTAALFYKPRSRYEPNIWVRETENWIVFPWERDDERPNREGYEHSE